MGSTIVRIIRAPFFFAIILLSLIPATFVIAVVSVGAWFEDGLHLLGLPPRQDWLPLVMGVIGYLVLGILVPVYFGNQLLGVSGAVMFPLAVLIVIALLDRW
jgi:hypothetical protein